MSTISGDTANGTTSFAYDALDRVTTYTPPSVISPQSYTWNVQPDRASIKTGTGTPLTVTFDAAGRPTTDSSSGTYSSSQESNSSRRSKCFQYVKRGLDDGLLVALIDQRQHKIPSPLAIRVVGGYA